MDISLNGAPHRFAGASLIELLAAQAIVVLTGALTTMLVAAVAAVIR